MGSPIIAGRSRSSAQLKLRPFISLLAWLAVFPLLLVGCTRSQQAASQLSFLDSQAEQANAEFNQTLAVMAGQASSIGDYTIGAEDLIEVTLFDIQDRGGDPRVISSRVSSSGYLTLPYVGQVYAHGLSPIELEENLRDAYQKYIHSPELTVLVREHRSYSVSVIGYVERAGVLELRGRKTLLEALALAGGINDEAGRGVRVTRTTAEGSHTIVIDLDRIAEQGDASLNLALLPNDVITVPRAGTFYVEGTVKKPGAYPLLDETTVSQAVATAGGIDPMLAKMSAATLYRKTDEGERIAIPIDLAALQHGDEVVDFEVKADDVIVVPLSTPKYLLTRMTGGVFRVGVNSSF